MRSRSWQCGLIAFLAFVSSCRTPANQDAGARQGAAALSVATQRNDPTRTGQYYDAVLDATTVGYHKFGKVWQYDNLDGLIYTQPVTLDGVSVNGVVKNLVFVGTSNNTLYAFDADGGSLAPVWTRSLGRPMDCSQDGCGGLFASRFTFGILSTPAISPDGRTLYVAAETDLGPPGSRNFAHILYALDPRNGLNELRRTQIAGTAPSATPNSPIAFNPLYHIQRPGLLIQNDVVYVAFGANNDTGPFYGWVFAYDAVSFKPLGVYCSTCSAVTPGTQGGGGIWQAGSGLAGDGVNNVFFMTGNGVAGAHASSIVKWNVRSGTPASAFTAANAGFLSSIDLDLGSAGPLVVPARNLLIGGGKEGVLHVLDYTTMQVLDASQRVSNAWVCQGSGPPSAACINSWGTNTDVFPHIHGTPVYWKEQSDLYVWAEKDYLRRFHLDVPTGKLSAKGVATDVARSPFQCRQPSGSTAVCTDSTMPGGMLSLSVNSSNGGGIIWAAVRHIPWTGNPAFAPEKYGSGTLRAIDASTLREIWHADQPFVFPKFPTVTIAYGRVFVPTFQNQMLVFGKLGLGGIALTGVNGWNSIPVALSNGGRSGTFTAVNLPSVAENFGANSSAAKFRFSGDFNADGRADIALAGGTGWRSIPVALYQAGGRFLGRNATTGPGTFGGDDVGTTNFGAWAAADGVVPLTGDFDGDGRTDIALVHGPGWNTIPIAFSRGEGSFKVTNVVHQASATIEAWIDEPRAQAVAGDFNGDGKTDIAVLKDSAWSSIPVGISRGDGTFVVENVTSADARSFQSLVPAGKPVIGDFNGDSLSDILLTRGSGWTSLPMVLSNGDGSFTFRNQQVGANFGGLAAEARGASLVVGDFDGDGRTDLALCGGDYWNSIPVARSRGDGSFVATNIDLTDMNWALLARNAQAARLVADIDGDGKDDIVLTGAAGWTGIPVAFSNGDGSFMTTNQNVGQGFPGFSVAPSPPQILSRLAGRF